VAFEIISFDSPVSGTNVIEWVLSGIISTSPLNQTTVGVGIPLTRQFNSVDALHLAIFGFIGSMNIGASPDSSFSNNGKIKIIN